MVVYRVEMPDGCGPYYSPLNPRRMSMGIKHFDSSHPTPADDFGWVKYNRQYYFGFDSMQSLYSWFGGWLKSILDHGGKILKYKVDEYNVQIGDSGLQLIFLKDQAQLLTS